MKGVTESDIIELQIKTRDSRTQKLTIDIAFNFEKIVVDRKAKKKKPGRDFHR